MNAVPNELRTPPLPVIAFIGCPELHKDVGSYFNHTIRPPFFSVGLAEATESLLVRLFGVKRQPKPFSTPDGILKADWFAKQRQRRAAVAVAFVPRSHVDGDPSSWMHMLAGLRAVRAAASVKGAALLLVVVQEGQLSELPPDRLAGLRSNLGLEHRQLCVISRQCFDPALSLEARKQLQGAQLGPLGQLVTEAAAAYYSSSAARLRQKQLDITAALGSSPPEVNAATAFKLAVLAEFRQDWLAAVSAYQAAAAALQGVPLGKPTVSCQRHAEVAAVAEVAHFKAMMLLLHQQRFAEALQQLRGHLAAFGPLPEGLPLAAAAAHYGWLSRQYQVAAEMVATSRMDEAVLQTHKDARPCHLLMCAAQLAISRKAAAEQLAAARGGGPTPFDASAVRKGRYLGQLEMRRPAAAAAAGAGSSDMTDAEFCLFLEAEERRVNHSQLVLDLLLQAQAAHLRQASKPVAAAPGQPAAAAAAAAAAGKTSHAAADRLQARLAWQIAEQQVDTHNLTAARKLLMQAVHTYRTDGWSTLLSHSLLLLRDVCQRLKLHREALLHSLELSCVADSLAAPSSSHSSSNSSSIPAAAADGLMDHKQAVEMAAAALAAVLKGPLDKRSSIMKAAGSSSSPSSSPRLLDGQPPGQQQQQQQLGGSSSPVAAAGSPSSPLGSSSSSSTAWNYVVQQLDLPAALQQVPAKEQAAQASAVTDLLLRFNQQDFGWWRILTVAGGFTAHAPDPAQLQLCVALNCHLPVALPLIGASLTLTDSQGSWTVPLAVGPGPDLQQQQQHAAASGQQGVQAAAAEAADALQILQLTDTQDAAAAGSWPLMLKPGSWQLLHVRFPPRCVGAVAAEQLQLQLSEHCTVSFVLGSFPPGRPALGSSSLPGGEPFKVRQGVRLGAWLGKVQHVGRLPQLQVLRPELLLVNEFAPLQVTVSASSPQLPATLQLSLRTAMGATPGDATLLAASRDGKLHAINPEGETLELPAIAAGSSFTQHLWVRSLVANSCRLMAVLSCPAVVSQSAELWFSEPFDHVTRLHGEVGVHTLVAASHAYAAANSDAGALATAAAAQSQGSEDASAAAGAAEGVPLEVGQVVFAQVLVRALHAVELQLLDAQLELQQEAGLQLLNKLSDQLAGRPLAVAQGSVHCLLLQLVPMANTSSPVSMGRLTLRWKRQQPAAVAQSSSSTSTSSSVSAGPAAAAAAELAVGAAPPDEVTTSLELPRVLVQDSLLSAKVVSPHRATAGIAFPFTVQLRNLTSKPQELLVSVQEAPSFVFSGSKQQAVTLMPKDSSSLSWTLVAHVSGQLPLPAVRVSSVRFSSQVVTQSAHVHVMPF